MRRVPAGQLLAAWDRAAASSAGWAGTCPLLALGSWARLAGSGCVLKRTMHWVNLNPPPLASCRGCRAPARTAWPAAVAASYLARWPQRPAALPSTLQRTAACWRCRPGATPGCWPPSRCLVSVRAVSCFAVAVFATPAPYRSAHARRSTPSLTVRFVAAAPAHPAPATLAAPLYPQSQHPPRCPSIFALQCCCTCSSCTCRPWPPCSAWWPSGREGWLTSGVWAG